MVIMGKGHVLDPPPSGAFPRPAGTDHKLKKDSPLLGNREMWRWGTRVVMDNAREFLCHRLHLFVPAKESAANVICRYSCAAGMDV